MFQEALVKKALSQSKQSNFVAASSIMFEFGVYQASFSENEFFQIKLNTMSSDLNKMK